MTSFRFIEESPDLGAGPTLQVNLRLSLGGASAGGWVLVKALRGRSQSRYDCETSVEMAMDSLRFLRTGRSTRVILPE